MERLGLWGTFQITDSHGNFRGPHLGARVATTELQKNIIAWGRFDRYDFLLGLGGHGEAEVTGYIASQNWDPRKILIYDGPLPLSRLEGERYHVLHACDLDLVDLLALRHAVGRPLAPVTVVNHTISYSMLMPMWLEILLGHVLPCDTIVCTSQASRATIEQSLGLLAERLSRQLGATVPAFRGRLEVIPLGVDVDYWHPETDAAKMQAKRQLSLPETALVVLCPARFSTHHKMDLRPFLLAVQRLLPMVGGDRFTVVLAGDEVPPENESRLIQRFVDKLGLARVVKIDTQGDPSRIRDYYRAADIFVSLVDNIQETFGLTVTQALACGLPALVSDWDGYKDTVVHGETGFRIRTYWAECDQRISALGNQRSWTLDHLFLAQSVSVDMDETVSTLYRLLVDPKLRAAWGRAGRRRAEEFYAWPVVIRQYRRLWDECQEKFGALELSEWTRQDHATLLSPEYFRCFSHYPSALITPETTLALLPTGAELAATPGLTQEVLLPPVLEQVFPAEVFQALLTQLSNWPVTFGSLVREVSAETGYPSDLVARQTMWLMKYGIVKPAKTIKEMQAAKKAGATEPRESRRAETAGRT